MNYPSETDSLAPCTQTCTPGRLQIGISDRLGVGSEVDATRQYRALLNEQPRGSGLVGYRYSATGAPRLETTVSSEGSKKAFQSN
jgi:hypothetical protein